jgi:hypothetical protein
MGGDGVPLIEEVPELAGMVLVYAVGGDGALTVIDTFAILLDTPCPLVAL